MPRVYKWKNLTGEIFGKLKVLSLLPEKRYGLRQYLCQCECGKQKIMVSSALSRNKQAARSCGCTKNKFKEKHKGWKGVGELSGSYFGRVIHSAKTRGHVLAIDIQYAWELFLKQDRRCALSGRILSFPKLSGRNGGNASLDRKNSDEGYEPGNVQWLHIDFNYAKRKKTDAEFIGMSAEVSRYQSQKLIEKGIISEADWLIIQKVLKHLIPTVT